MKLAIYIFLLLALVACKKQEETLTPSASLVYTLPQGSHDYDTTILDYYKKYGTYLLYQFTDRDAYWTPTGWKNARYDSAGAYWNVGFLAIEAEETYVGKQLEVIQRLWFRYYSDKFLKQFLPVKILLCSKIDSSYLGYDFSTTPTTFYLKYKEVAAWYNYDNISVNFGNANVENMTAKDSGYFIWKVSQAFMAEIFATKPVAATDDFTKLTSYTTKFTTQAAAYAAGSISTYYSASAQNDWEKFMLAMVSCSETMLNQAEAASSYSNKGILNPLKDTSGKIKKRYNIVRNYFITNYNVDLQAIGNAAIPQ
ncbi:MULTISPECIES: hypothetical protein [unclassified Chitinophaga]|uniref:hypothetical protein n=1 Tax=unclassified Chitinophaga TaxID=2619133 RepID=UPI0009CCC37B|nr:MULTISPECIES: hypothetical protein [unclassified Chitinophaga]OMP79246.1 hypothetical protein BW716_10325 [[Flexibacter] sp. ATCC 35208]WPV63798.1 hypothetical protein QQL36_18535 [Chitinophaga sp. LS1]